VGCKAITPHLVRLARRLEGKPFHLVAAHCQRNDKDSVLSYLRGKEFDEKAPNFTVTSFGGHPKVKGNGYVPYYMVFDHHGKLAHHHMCGDYHGGDGLKMIEWVDKLLEDAPAIYLGEEPFVHCDKLAKQVARKQDLEGAIEEIDERTEGTPGEDELNELARLKKAIVDYRDRMMAKAEKMLATDPSGVVDVLDDLADELGDTAIAAPAKDRLEELKRSRELREAGKIQKKYERILKKLDPGDSAKTRGKAADALEKIIKGHEHLPIAKTVQETIAELRK